MKTSRRMISLCLALLLLVGLFPTLAGSVSAKTKSGAFGQEGTLTWTVDTETGTLTISGTGAMEDCDNSYATWWYPFQSVIKRVVVEPGVTYIGDSSFSDLPGLSSVEIAGTVRDIGYGAFMSCSSLTAVTIPEGVQTMNYGVFTNCGSLKTVSLPDSVTDLGQDIFFNCPALTEVRLPANLKELHGTFSYCEALKSVDLPEGLTTIGDRTFLSCTSLDHITIPDSVTKIGTDCWAECVNLKQITLPVGLTELGTQAFRDSGIALEPSNWTNGLLYVQDWLVQAEEGLTKAVLRGDTAHIVQSVFSNCWELKEIAVPADNPYYASENGVLFNKDKTVLLCHPLQIEADVYSVPAGVRRIGPEAFYGTAFGEIRLPEGVTEIDDFAFCSMDDLERVSLPNSLRRIGDSAFSYCTRMQSLTLPEGLEEIAAFAFEGCYELTEISVPDSVTSLGEGAFAFSSQLSAVKLPKGLTAISPRLFEGCLGLPEVTIPETVTQIGAAAFRNCSGLCKAVIPEGVTEIADQTFSACEGLQEITLPDSVTDIGFAAFDATRSLSSIRLPAGLKQIGIHAFSSSNLTEVTIPDSVTEIGYGAFSACPMLESVSIPASVQSIEGSAFGSCPSLTNLTVDAANPNYSVGPGGELMSKDQTALYCVPASVTGSYAVQDQVKEIGPNCFEGCGGITDMHLPEGLERIGEGALSGLHQLEELIVPASVQYIGVAPFYGVQKLTVLSRDCRIAPELPYGDGLGDRYNTTVYGYYDSTAYWYAIENGYTFVLLDPGHQLSDVRQNAYYALAVDWAVRNKITAGTSQTTFSPNAPCTRAQVVTFLWRAKGCPEPKTASSPFTDVPENAYYDKAVLWAVENGVTAGATKTTFAPNRPCTRAQVVTFLWRAEGQPEPAPFAQDSSPGRGGSYDAPTSPFTDVSASAYYYKAVLWAVQNGVTSGTSWDTFSPEKTCTRGQVVTFLFRDLVG